MKTLSNSEVARQAGVNLAQMGRWLATGKLQRPKMSVTGGRILLLWTEADIERIRRYKAERRRASLRVNSRRSPEAGHGETV